MTTPTLRAYHGDESIKETYLRRVRAHRAADQIVQGRGSWMEDHGCAVGCTIHSSDHRAYERELGIPVELAHLEDAIFEGLPPYESKEWPLEFLSAIRPGADLTGVYDLWSAWNLIDPHSGVLTLVSAEFREVRRIVRETGEACLRHERMSAARAARAACGHAGSPSHIVQYRAFQ